MQLENPVRRYGPSILVQRAKERGSIETKTNRKESEQSRIKPDKFQMVVSLENHGFEKGPRVIQCVHGFRATVENDNEKIETKEMYISSEHRLTTR